MIRFNKPEITPLYVVQVVVATAILVVVLMQFAGHEFPRWTLLAATFAGLALSINGMREGRRRQRARHRMRDAMVCSLATIPVFGAMLAAIIADGGENMVRNVLYFSVLIVVATAIGIWSLLRWRALHAEAKERLRMLMEKSRKRARR